MSKNLYIISGCNGAGKTTASYTVLPEILDCREFVNADEIAHGLSPFNSEGMAIEAGRLMLRRIKDAGIKNLFRLFIPEVDYWGIYDNSEQPRIKIASVSKGKEIDIFNEELYKSMQDYVR